MSLAPETFARVRALLRRAAGIAMEPGKEYLVEARLGPLCAAEEAASIDALVERVEAERDGALERAAVGALTINETSFFRDHEPFQALREVLLPAAIERNRERRRLRLWSAGCSTGQEPYSLAMLLAERPELEGWDLRITASDICDEALARARAGTYSQLEVNRGLPIRRLLRHFDQEGRTFRVRDPVRARVVFERRNLALEPPPPEPQDGVLLRNVLIYFPPEVRRDVLRRVRAALAPGGFILLGAAETPYGVDPNLERADPPLPCCYQVVAAEPRSAAPCPSPETSSTS